MRHLMVMSPKHGKWKVFIKRLRGEHGIRFYASGSIKKWRCFGDFRHTKGILRRMKRIDIYGTLALFRERGACCDCEIISHAVPSLKKFSEPKSIRRSGRR